MKIYNFTNKVVVVSVLLASALLFGCSNDNPPAEDKVVIDLVKLQKTLGIDIHNKVTNEYGSSPATDAVKTLIIGPLTYENRGRPYTLSEPVTSTVVDDLADDIANSANYLAFVSLPTDQEFIEFEVPLVSSGWQVIAAASRNDIQTVDDLQQQTNKDSLVYHGFSENVYMSAEDINDADLTITLTRACSVDMPEKPKGCATFGENQVAVVTSAVEIIGVKLNDGDYTPALITFPLIVRDTPVAGQVLPSIAEADLESIVVEISASPTPLISSLTVLTTHRENPTETQTCRELLDTDSVAAYQAQCEVQEYRFLY